MKVQLKLLGLVLTVAAVALAQGPTTGPLPEAMRPPKGSKVAIVVFEDLECPACRNAEPALKDAEKTYKVPLVRKDFTLPIHRWSARAHLIARYFDTFSPQLGEEFRHWVFTNQGSINKSNIDEKAQKFAQEHKAALPLMGIDPSGQLQSKIDADKALGNMLGVNQTPTVYVVGDVSSNPMIMLNSVSELGQAVEQMKQRVQLESAAKASTKSSGKRSGAKKGSKK